MEEHGIKQTVDKVMSSIAAKREKTMADSPLRDEEQSLEPKKMEEITLKFGKGLVGEPFIGKDGKEYKQIRIPNQDPNDKSPWATFVARANAVHEDKFGKGMWMKLPADGHTSVRKAHCVGENADGRKLYETDKTSVSNKDLKSMVEFYKTRDKEQGKAAENKDSLKQRLSEKKSFVAHQKHDAPQKAAVQSKALAL